MTINEALSQFTDELNLNGSADIGKYSKQLPAHHRQEFRELAETTRLLKSAFCDGEQESLKKVLEAVKDIQPPGKNDDSCFTPTFSRAEIEDYNDYVNTFVKGAKP